MRVKGLLSIGFTVTYLLGGVLLAGAAPAGHLAQVIEGAKKEGTVSAKLLSAFSEKSMMRLEKEIREKYRVDLKIKYSPASEFGRMVADAITEQKVGAAPSYDLLSLTAGHIATLNHAGSLEPVDWKPLLSKESHPHVVLENPLMFGGLVYYTGHLGLIYNPERIKAEEVPKKLGDLGNPKWKGQGGVQNGTNSWLRWSFFLDKEKVVPTLRAIMKTGAIQGRSVDLLNRYLLREVSWSIITSEFFRNAQNKGMPAAWQSLDYSDILLFSLAVLKGARHPNAAKLLGLYLASPEGGRFTLEEGGAGNLYYPGNFESEIRLQDQRQGVREVLGDTHTGFLEFLRSKEAIQLDKEFKLILQGG